jgi:hypothetical protein
MATIDERVSKLETAVGVQAQEIKGFATKADLERMVNDLKAFVTNELSPMKADIGDIKIDVATMKNELTHKSSHADVSNAVNSLTWKMIGGVAFLSGVMALFKFLH